MRLLHTSDWHLGRSFHREDLLGAQRAFLDHLVAVVRAEGVDAVLVAGDVHDRAVPALGAVELFDEVLGRLAELSVPTVLISGNHDSARRLGVAARLIRASGVHLRTDAGAVGEPVLIPARDGGGELAVYGIPYLEPALVRERLGAPAASHAAVLGAAMDRVRADLSGRAEGTRSVVLAHAFVTGAEPSESERDIAVGGVPSAPASVFAGVDYVALGHLHNRQVVGERIRYSGSPLAYSFSEAGREKSFWLVDLGPGGELTEVRAVPCPVPRPVSCLRGRLEELLEGEEYARHAEDWLRVTLTDPVRPRQAMEKLRARFPHTLQLLFEPEGGAGGPAPAGYAERVRGRTDAEIAAGFVRHVRGDDPSPYERELLTAATEEGRRAR